jgi:alkanesulfonate monooxygenase SsuD/methylene tetrahydromethanopterin reductase-like flavin-dependent oxidoreductase (luciferase family)
MRLSVVTFLRPGTEPRDRPLGRIVDYARRIEKRGFPGIWVTDSLGRGRPTLDPLVTLGVLSAATERVASPRGTKPGSSSPYNGRSAEA